MKRYLTMFLLIIVCLVLQTTIFTHLKLTNVMPNLLVILTAASGFMAGRKLGMFSGFLCGGLLDILYGDVIGVCIFIFVLVGYINGMANKLYFKEDLTIPLLSIAASDLMYGLLYYICHYLLRGRFDILSYIGKIIMPEMIYTVIVGVFLYKLLLFIEEKLYPEEDVPLEKTDRTY